MKKLIKFLAIPLFVIQAPFDWALINIFRGRMTVKQYIKMAETVYNKI